MLGLSTVNSGFYFSSTKYLPIGVHRQRRLLVFFRVDNWDIGET
jgi:hypothetical protein